jgi:hypothetical protein
MRGTSPAENERREREERREMRLAEESDEEMGAVAQATVSTLSSEIEH